MVFYLPKSLLRSNDEGNGYTELSIGPDDV